MCVLHNVTTDEHGRHTALMDGYTPGDALSYVFSYTTELTDPVAAAEKAFELFNVGDDPEFGTPNPTAVKYRAKGLRSLSVGDVVIVGDVALACGSFGWDLAPDVTIPARAKAERWVTWFMDNNQNGADAIEQLDAAADWEDFVWITQEILKSDAVAKACLPHDEAVIARVVDSGMVVDSLYLDVHSRTLGAYLMVFIDIPDVSTAPRKTTGKNAAIGYAEVAFTKIAQLAAAYRAVEPND